MRHAYKIGADGIGVVTPSYFGCSDEVLFRYYVEICGALPDDFSVYTYVIPQLAKNDISVSLMVAINEAVELAKAFGSDNSSRFVNGVLGTAYRTLVKGASDNDETAKETTKQK